MRQRSASHPKGVCRANVPQQGWNKRTGLETKSLAVQARGTATALSLSLSLSGWALTAQNRDGAHSQPALHGQSCVSLKGFGN